MIVYDHKGKEFPSIAAMCRYYNITESMYRGRLKAGYSLEDTLTNNTSYYKSKHAQKSRVGESYPQKNGYMATITTYYGALDCDVVLNDKDHTKRCHVAYWNVKKGLIALIPRKEKGITVNERYLQKDGTYATVIDIKNPHDVTVSFEDGTIVYHKYAMDVKNGYVKNPNAYKNKWVGKVIENTCGMSCTIIDAKNDKDVTVQFEDGYILEHIRNFSSYKNGFSHPQLNRKNKDRNFHGYQVYGNPVHLDGQTFYTAIDLATKDEVFMTPQMMIQQ